MFAFAANADRAGKVCQTGRIPDKESRTSDDDFANVVGQTSGIHLDRVVIMLRVPAAYFGAGPSSACTDPRGRNLGHQGAWHHH
jgi:hypothetical protein